MRCCSCLCQGTHSCSRVPTPPAPQTFLRLAIPAFTHSCVVLSDKQEKPKRKQENLEKLDYNKQDITWHLSRIREPTSWHTYINWMRFILEQQKKISKNLKMEVIAIHVPSLAQVTWDTEDSTATGTCQLWCSLWFVTISELLAHGRKHFPRICFSLHHSVLLFQWFTLSPLTSIWNTILETSEQRPSDKCVKHMFSFRYGPKRTLGLTRWVLPSTFLLNFFLPVFID